MTLDELLLNITGNQPNKTIDTTPVNQNTGSFLPNNIFMAEPSPFLKRVLGPNQLSELNKQSQIRGGLNTFIDFLASPKNENLGGPLPYAFRSYLRSGVPSAGSVYNQYDKAIMDQLNLNKIIQDMDLAQKNYEINKYKAIPEELRSFGAMYGEDGQLTGFGQWKMLKDFATTDTKNWMFGQNNELFLSWLKEMKETEATKNTIINKMQGGASESYFKASDAIQTKGNDAKASLARYNEMIDLLTKFGEDGEGIVTGTGAEPTMMITRFVQMFKPDFNAKDAAGLERFDALSKQTLMPLVKQLGVNPTDKDLAFVVKGSPTLNKSKAGNLLILAALQESATRESLLAQAAAEWQIENSDMLLENPFEGRLKLNQFVSQYATKLMTDRKVYSQQLLDKFNQIINKSQDFGKPKSESEIGGGLFND